MARNTKTAALQPVPEQDVPALTVPEAEAIVSGPILRADNAMVEMIHERREASNRKLGTINEARQTLAHAYELFGQGSEKEAEAKSEADRAARVLYQGRVDGTLNADEVTAILGDVFGWKGKGDAKGQIVTSATPDSLRSRTPAPNGERIRKWVVRAHKVTDYLNGGEPDRFLEPVSRDDLQPALASFQNGQNGISRFFDIVTEKRRATLTRVNPAFDVKRVSALGAALSGGTPDVSAAEARAIVMGSPALKAAYASLVEIILSIGDGGTDENETDGDE